MPNDVLKQIQESTAAINLNKPPHWTWRRFLHELGKLAAIDPNNTESLIEAVEKTKFNAQSHTENMQSDMSQTWLNKLKQFAKDIHLHQTHLPSELISKGHTESLIETEIQTSSLLNQIPDAETDVSQTKNFVTTGDKQPTQTMKKMKEMKETKEANMPPTQAIPDTAIRGKFNLKRTNSLIIGILLWSIFCLLLGIFQRHALIDRLPLQIQRYIVTEEERSHRKLGRAQYALINMQPELFHADGKLNRSKWFEYGYLARERNAVGESILAYRRLISANPKDVLAMVNLAYVHLHSESEYALDPYEALRVIRKAHEISPENTYVLTMYAETMYQLAHFEDAVNYQRQAIATAGTGTKRSSRRYRHRLKNRLSHYESALKKQDAK